MTDIELVVKIEEERYNQIKRCVDNYLVSGLELAVKNGIPLPKGHGRLVECERLQEAFRRNVVGYAGFKQLFDIAPTIIEADKEKNDD